MADRNRIGKKDSEQLLRAMLVCSRSIHHTLETRAAESSGERLAPSKVQILRLLAMQEEQSPTQLASFLGVTRSAVTQLVDSMVKARLVRRSGSSGDRRSSRIQLAARGRRMVESLETEQMHLVRAAWRAASRDQRVKWVEVLDGISNALSDAVEDLEHRCYQCGAYADGTCVLVGAKAACRYEAART